MRHIIELARSIADACNGTVIIEPNCISIRPSECIFIEQNEMPKFLKLCSMVNDISILDDTLCFWLEP